ncbi:MAG TPA: glycosyltransferase [Candidatus Baltobacteraceae bacterium]|nr:glycosyltransferase [Candidatus Baltobacteraceae bacterium]
MSPDPLADARTRFSALPAPHPCCVASVAIPARNERSRIGRALAALAAQRDRTGRALDPATYEIIVFANGCSDDTEYAARRFAHDHPGCALFVVSAPAGEAAARHIGAARGAVMTACAQRMLDRHGAVLTTDADSVASPDWILESVAALRSADAVCGRIVLDRRESSELEPGARALHDLRTRYDFALARLEDAFDPLPADPWPRHAQHFGASFGLRASAYVRVGGVPPCDHLEDVALYRALVRTDARVRHSMRVRVTTSPRLRARVAGGLATFLNDLNDRACRGRTLLCEHPETTYETLAARGALRRWWSARGRSSAAGSLRVADRELVSDLFAMDEAAWHRYVDRSFTFGAAFADAYEHALAHGFGAKRDPVPMAEAVCVLDAQARALRASASSPTRRTARSGAG